MATLQLREIIYNRIASRVLIGALAVGVTLGGFAGNARPALAAGDCTVSSDKITMNSEETSLLAEINAHRASLGRAPLQADATLNKAAAWSAQDNARRGDIPHDNKHTDTLGRDSQTRFADCGFPAFGNGVHTAENVAWGDGSGVNPANGFVWNSRQSALDFWIHSAGHEANQTDPAMRFAGVARECVGSKCYYTVTFGSVAGPTASTTTPGSTGTTTNPGSTGTTTTPGSTGGTTTSGSTSITPTQSSTSLTWHVVSQGNRGERVETVQRLLRSHGYNVTVDGDYGPQTAQAVREFQQARNLATIDGVVHASTWRALIVTVQLGSRGNAVRAVQDELLARGYSITVDGDFGPQTQTAVRTYQQRVGLTVDGIVGVNTWNALTNGR